MSVGSMEQTSQPYLRPQHPLTNLRRLRHQPDQSGSTQELPILLPMVDFDVSFASPLLLCLATYTDGIQQFSLKLSHPWCFCRSALEELSVLVDRQDRNHRCQSH
jgi:hypothetical protein